MRDIPWCPADLYYARKLVAAIEAAGKAGWVRRSWRRAVLALAPLLAGAARGQDYMSGPSGSPEGGPIPAFRPICWTPRGPISKMSA